MLSITVGRVPGHITRVTVENGTTVGDLLSREGISLCSTGVILVSGAIAPPERVLTDNDTVLVSFPITGRVTVRRKGVWRIHKYDADVIFPSDQHAHNMDAPEVLDLYTGAVYDSRTRKYLRKLSKKDLAFIKKSSADHAP